MVGLGAMLTFGVTGLSQVERASKTLDKLKDKTDATSASIKKLSPKEMMVVGGVITSIGLGGAFALRKASIAASDFQQAMAQVQGVTRANKETMEGLTRAAEEMVLKTGRAPVETAQAMYELASAGGSVASVLKGAEPVLDLAAVGEISVAEAAKTAVAGVSAFGMTADKTRYLVDLLAASSRVSMVHMNEFPMVLGQMASAGQLAGYGAGKTIAAFSLMRNSAGTAHQATEELRQTLRGLATATSKEAVKAQQEIGKVLGRNFSVFDASTGKVRGLVGIVADLSEAYEKASPAQKIMFSQQLQQIANMGGISGIMKMMSATVETNTGEILKGADALRWMEQQMENVGGESETFAKTIKEQWGFFRMWITNTGQLLLVKLGQPLIEVLNKYVRPVIETLVTGLVRLVEQHPKLVKFAMGFTLIATALSLIIGPLMMLKGGILILMPLLANLGGGFQPLIRALGFVNAWMLPVVLGLAAIAAGIWAIINATNALTARRTAERLIKENEEIERSQRKLYYSALKHGGLTESEKKQNEMLEQMKRQNVEKMSRITNTSIGDQNTIVKDIKETIDGAGGSYKKMTDDVMNLDRLMNGAIEKSGRIVTIDLTRLEKSMPQNFRLPTPATPVMAPALATTIVKSETVARKSMASSDYSGEKSGLIASYLGPKINIENIEIKYQNPITRKEGEDTWRYIKEEMNKDADASGWPRGIH